MKVIALTGGKNVSSARFRIRQYIEILSNDYDIELVESYSIFTSYPPKNKLLRPLWLILVYISRLITVIKINFSDVDAVILQREVISTIYSVERFINKKIIFDVDDAIFLTQRNRSIEKIAKKSEMIFCGNKYLYDWFKKYNKNIYIIPTSVDTNRFVPKNKNGKPEKKDFIIGWSGTSSGLKYLYEIETQLSNFIKKHKDIKLHIVSDKNPQFQNEILKENLIFTKWSKDNEVSTIQNFDVGLMPLENTEWEKGKCSYKMLLYMACGIPSVVSDFGMNSEILSSNEFVGLGVKAIEDWEEKIEKIYLDENLKNKLILNSRMHCLEHFSLENISRTISELILRKV